MSTKRIVNGVSLGGRRPSLVAERLDPKDPRPDSPWLLVWFLRSEERLWRIVASNGAALALIEAPHVMDAECAIEVGDYVGVPSPVCASLERARSGFTFVRGGPDQDVIYAAPLDDDGNRTGEYHEAVEDGERGEKRFRWAASVFSNEPAPGHDQPVAQQLAVNPDLLSELHRAVVPGIAAARHWLFGDERPLQITHGPGPFPDRGLLMPIRQTDWDSVPVVYDNQD